VGERERGETEEEEKKENISRTNRTSSCIAFLLGLGMFDLGLKILII
jgi:hypothetical protein